MGEYEPNDSRNVTRKKSDLTGEPTRTGPREGETRRDDGEREGEDASRTRGIEPDEQDHAQVGYGNSRTEQGRNERQMAG
jgi:hypothetical protein